MKNIFHITNIKILLIQVEKFIQKENPKIKEIFEHSLEGGKDFGPCCT